MNAYEIFCLVFFILIMRMFCQVEVRPFRSEREKYIWAGGVAGSVLLSVVWKMLFPDSAMALQALFTQTLPSLILCRRMARHKDMRFWFVFCSIDVLAFTLEILSSGLLILCGFDNSVLALLLKLFGMLVFSWIFRVHGKSFREAMDKVEKPWGLLSILMVSFYGYSYFLCLYPEPWKQRPEYAPVIFGYGVVSLLCYCVIVKMVFQTSRIYDLEQSELKMKLQIEKQKREIEKKKTQIMLEQIRPHFIYNTLNSIRYLIKKDADVAYQMIYDFSKYLRLNVDALTEQEHISWREEQEHINAYLNIEKIRFGNRLNVEIEIEEADLSIPPLAVEPLVENAVKHGIAPKEEGGTIWLRGRWEGNGYLITIEDDGVGFEVEKLDTEKAVGISYVRAQLASVPGAECGIESTPGQGTKAWIFLNEQGREQYGREAEDHCSGR